MPYSSLVSYKAISPNRNSPRNHVIDTITIHCFVGQVTAKRGCEVFLPSSKEASCNYVVGYDGSIGLSVDEADRSWCTSSGSNDHRAITIEVASETIHPYAITDAAYHSLIVLCADICQRNNIKELRWVDDKSLIGKIELQNMTVHRWFANKSCPGDYIFNRLGEIAKRVNDLINEPEVEETQHVCKHNICYARLPDVPSAYRPSIRKAMERGLMSGYSDVDPSTFDDNFIDVTEDMCRIITIMDRANLF